MTRIMQLANEQKNRALAIILIGSIGTGVAVYSTMGFGFYAVLSHAVSSFVIIRFMAFISVITLQRKYYQGDLQAFISDVAEYEARKKAGQLSDSNVSAEATPPKQSKTVEIVVVDYPDSPAGSFKDSPIYDWLVIDVEGEQFKVIFEGVLEVQEGQDISLKNGQILLAPGILYSKAP